MIPNRSLMTQDYLENNMKSFRTLILKQITNRQLFFGSTVQAVEGLSGPVKIINTLKNNVNPFFQKIVVTSKILISFDIIIIFMISG